MNDFMLIHEDALRLMRRMFDDEEFWAVVQDLQNSDGWLIIPFKDPPVLCEIKNLIPKMLAKTIMHRMFGENVLSDYRLN